MPEHDDVIKWKHFPRNWPFVREIHRSPVNFPHKGQWRGALMFSLIYAWMNDWVNNREAGDLRRQHGHYDVIVMSKVRMGCNLYWDFSVSSPRILPEPPTANHGSESPLSRVSYRVYLHAVVRVIIFESPDELHNKLILWRSSMEGTGLVSR